MTHASLYRCAPRAYSNDLGCQIMQRGGFVARCSCGEESKWFFRYADALAWKRAHSCQPTEGKAS